MMNIDGEAKNLDGREVGEEEDNGEDEEKEMVGEGRALLYEGQR